MMKEFFALSILPAAALGLVTMTASAADAQSRNCGPRDSVVDRLAEGFGETRQSIGLGANNQIVEQFANEETGSWTITVTMPNGITCLVASGQSFERLAEVLPSADRDA